MFNFLIAPDFPPQHFTGWHLLNTLLQRASNIPIHLLTPSSAAEQNELIACNQVDMIYANPFDAAHLIREKGFLAVTKPSANSDEMVIATAKSAYIQKMSDLRPGMKIAITKNYDIKLIGLRLLEAANLTENDLEWLELPSFQAVARMILRREVDAGFFVASAYHSLSRLTLEQLHTVIESHIRDITHVILIAPQHKDKIPLFQQIFIKMRSILAGERICSELNMQAGFEELTQEDVEFMIDLMDTLLD